SAVFVPKPAAVAWRRASFAPLGTHPRSRWAEANVRGRRQSFSAMTVLCQRTCTHSLETPRHTGAGAIAGIGFPACFHCVSVFPSRPPQNEVARMSTTGQRSQRERPMDKQERALRAMIAQVKDGRMSRRAFVRKMVALGLSAPMAGLMLSHSGVAWGQSAFTYKPTKAGGGGPLKMLWWQAPTLLNPHFAVGTKDQDASRIFYEPLAGWDADGNLVPFLAAEIPSQQNGGLSDDGKSVT